MTHAEKVKFLLESLEPVKGWEFRWAIGAPINKFLLREVCQDVTPEIKYLIVPSESLRSFDTVAFMAFNDASVTVDFKDQQRFYYGPRTPIMVLA